MAAINCNNSVEEDAFSEKLIQLVSEKPAIYDKADSTYKDIRIRENIWQHIATQMCTTPDIVTKRWKAIRDAFIRRNRDMHTKSGQAAKKSHPYKFHKQLSFLDIHNKGKSSTISNFESITGTSSEEEFEETVPDHTVPAQNSVTPGKRRKCEKSDPLADGILTYLNEKNNRPAPHPSKERDSDELWLLSLAPTLRRFNDYQKGIAKLKVQQVLLDLEFGTGFPNQQNQSWDGSFPNQPNQSWEGTFQTNKNQNTSWGGSNFMNL